MPFPRTPRALMEHFERLLAKTGGTSRRMFGASAGFAGTHMFCGVLGTRLFVRLSEEDRARLLALEGAEVFDPMGGRPMRDYVVVPHELMDEERELLSWLQRAFEHARRLPARARAATPRKTPGKRAPGGAGPERAEGEGASRAPRGGPRRPSARAGKRGPARRRPNKP